MPAMRAARMVAGGCRFCPTTVMSAYATERPSLSRNPWGNQRQLTGGDGCSAHVIEDDRGNRSSTT
jgi:hypothetical protein